MPRLVTAAARFGSLGRNRRLGPPRPWCGDSDWWFAPRVSPGCRACRLYRHSFSDDEIPLLAGQFHQGLIGQGEHLTCCCPNWSSETTGPRGWAQAAAWTQRQAGFRLTPHPPGSWGMAVQCWASGRFAGTNTANAWRSSAVNCSQGNRSPCSRRTFRKAVTPQGAETQGSRSRVGALLRQAAANSLVGLPS